MVNQSKLYTVRAVILARRDQGEADRVVTCLTPAGRYDYLAKGARKTLSRKAGHLELFSTSDMLLSRVTGSWDIISQAESRSLRPELRDDFELGTYARYISELVIRFFEQDSDSHLYNLVEETLSALTSAERPELLVRWYEQQILLTAGYRPEWESCVGDREGSQCRNPLKPRPDDRKSYGVDYEKGGALCPTCYALIPAGSSSARLSPSALSWFQALQHKSYELLLQYSLHKKTAVELARIMEQYITYYLERRPASLKVMQGKK
ncbi:MAG: DNA repair protein RecO [Anaerolineae bacterium]|nr:DNA repair protein RecO [Anaerolineae bacterium]